MVVFFPLLNIGQSSDNSAYLNAKIRIANMTACLLAIIGFIYFILTFSGYFVLSIISIVTVGFAILCLVFNNARRYNLARFILAVMPLLLTSFYHAYIVPRGGQTIYALNFGQFALALYPWVLFDLREKNCLYPSVAVSVMLLIGQPFLNDLIESDLTITLFSNVWLVVFTSFCSALIMLVCLMGLHGKNAEIEGHLVEARDTAESSLKELKRVQEQLVQKEKMASLGVLTAGVAHEINNPLNYIMGGYMGLKKHLPENDETEEGQNIQMLLDCIKTGVDRAAAIVKGLNQMSRVNRDLEELCQIHPIIDNCLVVLHNQLKRRVVVKKKYSDEDLVAMGNVGKLHQAFINLIKNASDAIEDKGEITISTKRLKNFSIISISDTGCGIKKKDLAKISDPFFTTKVPGKGTGLGLSITYNIIHQHKGRIKFKSTVGKGTTAIVKLPSTPNK